MEISKNGEVFVLRGLKELEEHSKGEPKEPKQVQEKISKDEIERVQQAGLPGLSGSHLAKKNFLEFLFNTDLEELEELYGKKEEAVYDETDTIELESKPETTVADLTLDQALKLFTEASTFRCKACQKTFTTKGSLKRHHERYPVCVEWLSIDKKMDTSRLTKGIHLLVDDLLERAVSEEGRLECKFCKCIFTNKGNHHKHFNTSIVCNKMALIEFKKVVAEF